MLTRSDQLSLKQQNTELDSNGAKKRGRPAGKAKAKARGRPSTKAKAKPSSKAKARSKPRSKATHADDVEGLEAPEISVTPEPSRCASKAKASKDGPTASKAKCLKASKNEGPKASDAKCLKASKNEGLKASQAKRLKASKNEGRTTLNRDSELVEASVLPASDEVNGVSESSLETGRVKTRRGAFRTWETCSDGRGQEHQESQEGTQEQGPEEEWCRNGARGGEAQEVYPQGRPELSCLQAHGPRGS